MIEIILWCLGAYVLIGIGVTVLLSQTPYSYNGWVQTTLLWPLFLYALLWG